MTKSDPTHGAPPPFPDSLSGLVERVTFFNEENGFAVLKVKARGHRDLVTVVGNLPSVSAGEWLTAQGRWIQDRDFGTQLKAELITSSAPTTREGIEKYLGSGMVKGIGPVYAKKLVDRFGEKIFDVIENESAKLEDIDGVGPKRRKQIKDAWGQQKIIREIMVFLHSQGVSTSRAVRIYKTYGDQAIDKVRSDPYRLARDIPGIGFHTADKIARQMGIPPDSLLRASAALSHVLLSATQEGHCALPESNLCDTARQLLEIDSSIISSALAQSLSKEEVIRDHAGEEPLIYLPHLLRDEHLIARRIRQLSEGQPRYPTIDLAKALAWYEDKSGQTLATSQRQALELALTHRTLIITGGPGVGKTTLTNAILKILTAKKVRSMLCAPTGRAAKRMSESTGLIAKTIHRLLEVVPGTRGFVHNESNPLDSDLFVVDECSMIDVPLMASLLLALPRNAHLILIGDVDQLPSVGPGNVLRDLIASQVLPVVRLTEVFRQAAHSRIITTAHQIQAGLIPELSATHSSSPDNNLTDFYFIDRAEPENILSTLVDMVQNRIPTRFKVHPIRDIQLLCPMNRGSLGIRELNLRMQSTLNPVHEGEPWVEKFGSRFHLRDKVIQTENNYDKDVFNGDIGHILRIDPEEKEVTVLFDQREVVYDYSEMDELSLAYAITIHKSQGSEFPVVVIPIAMQHYMLLQRNLIYTGITRGRKLVVVIGQTRAFAAAIRNDHTELRHSALLARLKNEAS